MSGNGEGRRNLSVNIAGIVLVLSLVLLVGNVTYAFWADHRARQERIQFVNELFLANCQNDRAQDIVLLTLVDSVIMRPLPPDATEEQIKIRQIFERQARILHNRVDKGCPIRILIS